MINLLGLIEMYNTYATNNVYHEVASSLLKHYRKLDKMTSLEIADLCNVSPSTLARFFKKMDYPHTVSKLPEIVANTKVSYQYGGNYAPAKDHEQFEGTVGHYIHHLKLALDNLEKHIDEGQLEGLAKAMLNSKKVVFIGCPIPQEVWRFQVELTLAGIESSAFLDPNNQYIELDLLESESTVFYFNHCLPAVLQYEEALRSSRKNISTFAVLSTSPDRLMPSDFSFHFDGTDTEQDFILMNIFMNLLGTTFRNLVRAKNICK